MLIGLNLFDGDDGALQRQSAACDALVTLDGVEPVNIQFARGGVREDPRIATRRALTIDSEQLTGSIGRRRPVAREMFDVLATAAAGGGHRYFAYINSDIVVTGALVNEVGREPRETYAVSRCDVGGEAPSRLITSGQDMFVVAVRWWQQNRARFRPYILGEACWDNVYTAMMMCHSDGVVLNRDPLILHERHAAIWRDSTPAARYNGMLAALDARYFDQWSQYWHRLEALRAAASPRADEELRLVRDGFVWRRSAPQALRQFIRGVRARRHFRRLQADWIGASSAS
jgi:hypothetical protein